MCGIVGTFNLNQKRPIVANTLHAMLGALRHRGPDQFGSYLFQDEQDGIGLGSARLSIIDLGGGQQPISNETGTLWIVFNGEIFNYIELRPELERQGHQFQTDCDTEVILHLYEQYGTDCLDYLNGQFVFAIWDEARRELFLARDRLGIRPLYYTVQNGSFVFGSEIKSLLTHPGVTAVFDPISLGQIFTFWSPLSPRSAFQGIHALPPGHYLRLKAGETPTPRRYWQVDFPPAGQEAALTTADAAGQLRHLLVDATQIRLRADVPVGAYLSGGLDSSTITALIRHYTNNHLETFSIAFADEAFDESPFQRQMAAHLGTNHNLITCTHEEIGQVFPDVIWHTEIPIMRTSPAPLYLLSRLVRQHNFKVVLTGEGADEFLGGYNIFKEAKIRRFWARQPDSTARPALLKKLYGYIGGLASENDAYLYRFFGQGLQNVAQADYSHAIRWRNTGRSKRFFGDALRDRLGDSEHHMGIEGMALPSEFNQWSPLAQAQYLEISVFMAEYLLSSQGDRVGMAHSVEGRFPFLDHRVVEFCNQLPPHLKLRGLTEKYLLKQAVRDLLPEEIWRRPKRPYRAPIHRSFFPEKRPLPWVADLLSPANIEAAGCFNPLAVTALVKKIERFGTLGETDDMALAGILSTQLVHEKFIDNFQPPSPLTEADDIKSVKRET
jgi:asparagine synthase (glutamine-hydrolysing)